MCVLSIKVPIRKKSGNLFNDPRMYVYIYIYIYCHEQTNCFVVSQLFSVARHAGLFRLGLKHAILYARLGM